MKKQKKWKSAEAKREHEALQASWEKIKSKHAKPLRDEQPKRQEYKQPVNPRIAEMRQVPSLDTGVTGAVTLGESPVYTGDKIIGIGTMHKSNAVPIFNDAAAKDLSTMRR